LLRAHITVQVLPVGVALGRRPVAVVVAQDALNGHPQLRRGIEALAIAAAEELPVRKAAGSMVSGRDVGTLCGVTVSLSLRSESFLTYVRYLIRKDWDMVWTPKARILFQPFDCAGSRDKAKCMAHFQQDDRRAWRALAYRMERRMMSEAEEIAETFAAASVTNEVQISHDCLAEAPAASMILSEHEPLRFWVLVKGYSNFSDHYIGL
ncbi:mtr, partial [Symbiodinium necroappetens]